MPIQVKCANADCGKSLRIKDELAGKTIRCPGCQQPMKVPAAAVEAAFEEAEEAPAKPAKPAVTAAAPPARELRHRPCRKPPPRPLTKRKPSPPKHRCQEGRQTPPPKDEDDEPDPELEKLWEQSDMLNNHERLQVKKKFAWMRTSSTSTTRTPRNRSALPANRSVS